MDAEAEWENYTQNGGSWFFQIITWNEGDKRGTSWLIECLENNKKTAVTYCGHKSFIRLWIDGLGLCNYNI